jgi:hypothetical protein
MSQVELAAYVSAHLERAGIDLVLSGGAAVSIYTENVYQSSDIDLIADGFPSRNLLRRGMLALGFRQTGRHYEHPDTPWFVEFPEGPPHVGGERIGPVEELEVVTGRLRVISATDCVKDRLAAYYHWGDRQALEQARLVASRRPVDLQEVERWSTAEGKKAEFDAVVDLLRPTER